jgi:hypothetical protein
MRIEKQAILKEVTNEENRLVHCAFDHDSDAVKREYSQW